MDTAARLVTALLNGSSGQILGTFDTGDLGFTVIKAIMKTRVDLSNKMTNVRYKYS